MTRSPISIERPGRAPLRVVATPGKPSITAASRLSLATIDGHSDLLHGRGIEWGSGSGLLSIAAATHPRVQFVLGLEIDASEVVTARTNAELNGVADRTGFLVSDSFKPQPDQDASILEDLRGTTDFLIANPPTSAGDDGLEWRRRVLRGALDFLVPGANVLLQVSRQYGTERTKRLADDVGAFAYHGVLNTTAWVPFDQDRPELHDALDWYATEESRSELAYPFLHPEEERQIDANEAQRLRESIGASPRTQWQMHHFTRI